MRIAAIVIPLSLAHRAHRQHDWPALWPIVPPHRRAGAADCQRGAGRHSAGLAHDAAAGLAVAYAVTGTVRLALCGRQRWPSRRGTSFSTRRWWRGHWVWEVPGLYFGIPLINYAGWLLSAALLTVAVRPPPAGAPADLRLWRSVVPAKRGDGHLLADAGAGALWLCGHGRDAALGDPPPAPQPMIVLPIFVALPLVTLLAITYNNVRRFLRLQAPM